MSDKKTSMGIHALYRQNPEEADRQLWGREVDPVSRRGFIKNSGLAAMAAALGATIPFAGRMPGGLIPSAFADTEEAFTITGKEGLRILNDRPINAETPPHLLDDDFTPAKHFF
ncbi:MAG: twin-arginine translocation signal domain-containing protein, partial [Halioglobus sp.]